MPQIQIQGENYGNFIFATTFNAMLFGLHDFFRLTIC